MDGVGGFSQIVKLIPLELLDKGHLHSALLGNSVCGINSKTGCLVSYLGFWEGSESKRGLNCWWFYMLRRFGCSYILKTP